MGMREQHIEIGLSIKVITRCVYDIRNDQRFKLQTGFIQYDNTEIPVWRPYDPSDMSWDAPWKKGKWKNIYALSMKRKEAATYIEYETTETTFEDITISLPKISTTLMHSFEMYLKRK
jgi:hypothetical protein